MLLRRHSKWFSPILILLSVELVLGEIAKDNEKTEASKRGGKIFSLFSVVQFKNSGCRSTSALSTGQSPFRNGTCYTNSECSNKGGTASGNCAAGFGVCCVFLFSSTGATINQNCSYLRNPGFPSVYSSNSGVTYTINKCSNDVCFLRLDFETFTLLGPTVTTETQGGLCPDTFRVLTNTGQSIPTICGQNTGQHIYVDIGTQSGDSATLTFSFTGTSTARNWEIKVSQIECSNPNAPPDGCLQYFTTLTGRITTFNFIPTTSTHLANQEYSSCVRRNSGYCCVQYQVCQNVINPFTLDTSTAIGTVDSQCTSTDYIIIQGSSSSCSSNAQTLYSRYCGNYLGTQVAMTSIPVCDCTSPFFVHFHTDGIADVAPAGGIAMPNAAGMTSRGTCLDYMQVPCTTN